MKFCFFTDIHATSRAPVSRKDNYVESIVTKLNYLAENTQDVDFYICGGDIFHTADPATSSVVEIVAALKKFKKPIYTAVGSHDLVGYQFDTIKRSAIGILQAAGLIKIIPDGIVIDNIYFKFSHHSYQKDKDPESYLISSDELIFNNPAIKVHVIHGSFYTNKIFDAIHKIEDYPNLGIVDLVLCGHIHHPFEKVVDNTHFYNPGSITRTAIDQQHNIKAGVITFEVGERKKILIEDLFIPYEKSVFINKENNIEFENLATVDFTDVFNDVNSLQIKDAINLKELILGQSDIDEETKKMSLDVLEKVKNGKQ